MKFIFTAIAFLLLISLAFAQILLPPAETEFNIIPIILTPVTPGQPGSPDPLGDLPGDFTGTSQTIALRGDFNYLSVRWNANFVDKSERNIGVRCYLNCPNPGDDIDENCKNFQKCEYLGLVGPRSCAIPNPDYIVDLPPQETNAVACKFYDPAAPSVEFLPYPTRTFRPIDFSLSLSEVTATVGQAFSFPISVIPRGLIAGAYTFKVTELLQPNALFIERNTGFTEELGYGQPGRFSPRITYLISKPTNIEVLANANSDPIKCNDDTECSYIGDSKCVDNKCWKKVDVRLNAGKASLPEFDAFGFFQIMMLSSVVLLITFRRK
jgi:hypothetical protein